MSKCIKCGKSTVVRGHVKLADAAICTPCFKSLGFKLNDTLTASLYRYDDIKNGRDKYYQRKIEEDVNKYDAESARSLGISLQQFRQLEAAGSTEMENKILGMICALLRDERRNPDALDVALGDNGSVLVMINGVVIMRYKADAGVKWICFEHEGGEKIRISGPARLNSMAERIAQAYDSGVM